ncbi:hypothetical protein Srot_1205 [Segniliparus rotundus DSM 44985]|uniref:Uncharacterized protein n=1 Tax=Segniliparus rotundus (strain ATCC BAA-972 / CDC 1076 / CIP 108378 / DSM 44985 / JCM 13578) TaxID=640132 RepID=D6ZFF2_SEGRD|nr:hypothetical protein [Segniliparus rotundus]ADG97676.1 hypothetical protein Srot_1205 [Segniliparus rotundus DSM 44985]
MGMVEELAQLAENNREELTRFRKETQEAFRQIRHEHRKATTANEKLVEEQEQQLHEKSQHAKHDELEAASQRKIGHTHEDPGTDTPHTRAIRDNDPTNRNITPNHPDEDEDEEPEPYRRPQHWHDQNHHEEKPPTPSPHRDWGRSTRRIGNHNNEDD